MTLPAHSKLGASAAHRWMECPGSVRLSAGLEDVANEHSARGTVAHTVAAACLNYEDAPRKWAGEVLVHEGFSLVFEEEDAEAVQVYLDTVRGDALEHEDNPPARLIEHRFHLEELHPDLFGTADCVQVWPGRKLMRVYDYKHGAGVPVEVLDNPQLKYYALGALLSYRQPVAEVELVIVQPRCPHPDGVVRRHRFKTIELLDFKAELIEAARLTESPDAPFKTGEHCRWCKAAALCPEARRQAQEAAKREFANDSPYNPGELAETLALLPAIEAWVESVRAFAYGEAMHGRTPPGFKLVDKRPTRKWKVDEHTVESELAGIGLSESDIYAPREVKSPAQIEKVIGKAKKNADKLAVVDKLCEAVSSGVTLVPEADERPAVKRSAQEDFAHV